MYIAYLYDVNWDLIAQIENILDLDVSKQLNDVSKASFGLYHNDPYCKREYLKEYRRVRITMIVDNIEKEIFDWVIRWFEADLEKTSIKLESFEHYFSRRILHQDYIFTDQSVDTILQTILDDINTRYQTNITLDCGISTLTSKEYKKAETFLKVLQDLADNGFEFIFDDMVLKFKTTVWVDRSTGENFVEYRFDVNEPDDRSINSIKMTVDGKELANGVIWKAGSDYTEDDDATSITEFGLIEWSFTTSWDDATTTASYLDDHKDSLSEYKVETTTNDFFEANLWDLVKVYIYVWNDVLFYDWSMKVVQKDFTAWDLPKIEYTLGKTKIKSKDFIDEILEIQERVKTLELK